jgi:hypothetical protein
MSSGPKISESISSEYWSLGEKLMVVVWRTVLTVQLGEDCMFVDAK